MPALDTAPPPSLACPPAWSFDDQVDEPDTSHEFHTHKRRVADLPVGWVHEGGADDLDPITVGLAHYHHPDPQDGDTAPAVALSVPADSFDVRYLSAAGARDLARSLIAASQLLDQPEAGGVVRPSVTIVGRDVQHPAWCVDHRNEMVGPHGECHGPSRQSLPVELGYGLEARVHWYDGDAGPIAFIAYLDSPTGVEFASLDPDAVDLLVDLLETHPEEVLPTLQHLAASIRSEVPA